MAGEEGVRGGGVYGSYFSLMCSVPPFHTEHCGT